MSGKNRVAIDRSLTRLSDLVDKVGIQLKPEARSPAAVEQKAEVQKIPPPPPIVPATDEDAFLEAMNDVHRASWRHELHPSPPPPPAARADSDLEDRKLMQTALEEENAVPVLDHPEYIEGWIGIAGRKFLPMLRNGLYSIQGQIDLHGFNRIEAQIAVEDYIEQMSRFQSCCIKIIHGRGINSPTDRATLKEDLQRLLKTRRMSRYVVAYASAPACDGGVGAVYVLLCRQ